MKSTFPQLNGTLLPDVQASLSNAPNTSLSPDLSANGTVKKPASTPASPVAREENKESFDYQKKQALAKGPQVKMDTSNFSAYGMPESLFTALKDLFATIITHQSHTGVVIPVKFLEVLRRDNEAYRSPMHQDAHEFLNLLLNEVVEQVEAYSKKLAEAAEGKGFANGHDASIESNQTLVKPTSAPTNPSWVHELFEGTLTSETRCLTCETKSQRDEAFLDLSVDLEEHTSVTSCLRKFSEEEMLCERNKFHCDKCGGLQEAEKRMKIKRLPRILALHLKRFKYTEEMDRLQKLFHRVVFPFHLRLLNTTDDAEDPDRLYELYAIIVHLGSTPFHGHYVSIIKTKDRGWLLFDDELVLPVDANYVRNYFGGDPRNPACAYVLFYQETTEEAVQEDLFAHPATPRAELMQVASEPQSFKPGSDVPASPLSSEARSFALEGNEHFTGLVEAVDTPLLRTPSAPLQDTEELKKPDATLAQARHTFEASELSRPLPNDLETRNDERVISEEPHAGKDFAGKSRVLRSAKSGSFNRLRNSISLRQKPKFLSSREGDRSDANASAIADMPDVPTKPPGEAVEKPKSRFSLGRKKSAMLS